MVNDPEHGYCGHTEKDRSQTLPAFFEIPKDNRFQSIFGAAMKKLAQGTKWEDPEGGHDGDMFDDRLIEFIERVQKARAALGDEIVNGVLDSMEVEKEEEVRKYPVQDMILELLRDRLREQQGDDAEDEDIDFENPASDRPVAVAS